jgi:hypothetical protein
VQPIVCSRFNINHLQTTESHKAQQDLECGSEPGALPGAPRGSPLDSASENFELLKAVETRGFHSYKFDYSRRSERLAGFNFYSI